MSMNPSMNAVSTPIPTQAAGLVRYSACEPRAMRIEKAHMFVEILGMCLLGLRASTSLLLKLLSWWLRSRIS